MKPPSEKDVSGSGCFWYVFAAGCVFLLWLVFSDPPWFRNDPSPEELEARSQRREECVRYVADNAEIGPLKMLKLSDGSTFEESEYAFNVSITNLGDRNISYIGLSFESGNDCWRFDYDSQLRLTTGMPRLPQDIEPGASLTFGSVKKVFGWKPPCSKMELDSELMELVDIYCRLGSSTTD